MRRLLIGSAAALMLFTIPQIAGADTTHPHPKRSSEVSDTAETTTTLQGTKSDHGRHRGSDKKSEEGKGKDHAKGHEAKKNPTVMFVLHGMVTSYAAYVPASTTTPTTTATNGSVTLQVTSSNQDRSVIKGATLTFVIAQTTKVELHDHAPVGVGDRVIVKLRAAKNTNIVAAQAATPPQSFVAFQLIDQGSKS